MQIPTSTSHPFCTHAKPHTESSKRPICIGSRFSPAATMGRACKFTRPAGPLDSGLYFILVCLKIACRGLRAAGQRDGDRWICSYWQKCAGRALFANMRLSQSTFFVGKFSRLQTYQAALVLCVCGWPAPYTGGRENSAGNFLSRGNAAVAG
jgi:hypothetical protein